MQRSTRYQSGKLRRPSGRVLENLGTFKECQAEGLRALNSEGDVRRLDDRRPLLYLCLDEILQFLRTSTSRFDSEIVQELLRLWLCQPSVRRRIYLCHDIW